MPIPEELTRQLHDSAVAMKEHTWHHHSMRDLEPHCVCVFEKAGYVDADVEKVIGGIEATKKLLGDEATPLDHIGVPEALTMALSLTMQGFNEAKSGDRLEAVVIFADGRMRSLEGGDSSERATKVERGDLHRDFMYNPSTDVVECMVTHIFESDLVGGIVASNIVQPYVISDGGVLEWKEALYTVNEDPQGAIPDAVRPWFADDRREVRHGDAS